jgi:hypothetical protein
MSNMVLGGRHYQLGNFMSKELQLADLADFGHEVSRDGWRLRSGLRQRPQSARPSHYSE